MRYHLYKYKEIIMDKHYLEGSPFEPVKLKMAMKKPFSHAGFIGFAFIAMSQVSTYLLVGLIKLLDINISGSALSTIASALQYIVAYPVCLLTTVTMPKKAPEKHKTKVRYLLAAFAVCILMMYAGIFAGNFVSNIINTVFRIKPFDPLESSIGEMSALQTFITTAVFAPVFEELLFRKLPLDRIRGYGDGPAVFISALVFGVIHCNIYQFFYAFAVGMVLGYIYVKTGKITYTILLHSAINIFGGFIPTLINTKTFADSNALIEGILSFDIYAIGTVVYSIITYALIITGIVMVIVYAKKVKNDFSEYAKGLGNIFMPSCFNCGMIFIYITSLLIIILNTIQSVYQ